MNLSSHVALCCSLFFAGHAVSADVLVTTSGERIRTAGPWVENGRVLEFRGLDGRLRSIRTSSIDLEASAEATARAATARDDSPSPQDHESADSPSAERALTLTNESFGGRTVSKETEEVVDGLEALAEGLGEVVDVLEIHQETILAPHKATLESASADVQSGDLARVRRAARRLEEVAAAIRRAGTKDTDPKRDEARAILSGFYEGMASSVKKNAEKIAAAGRSGQ